MVPNKYLVCFLQCSRRRLRISGYLLVNNFHRIHIHINKLLSIVSLDNLLTKKERTYLRKSVVLLCISIL